MVQTAPPQEFLTKEVRRVNILSDHIFFGYFTTIPNISKHFKTFQNISNLNNKKMSLQLFFNSKISKECPEKFPQWFDFPVTFKIVRQVLTLLGLSLTTISYGWGGWLTTVTVDLQCIYLSMFFWNIDNKTNCNIL